MALLMAKALAAELGICAKSVYRAYRTGEIPAAQIGRTLLFDLAKVRHSMERRAEQMPYQRASRVAPGGVSRLRVADSPRSVKRR